MSRPRSGAADFWGVVLNATPVPTWTTADGTTEINMGLRRVPPEYRPTRAKGESRVTTEASSIPSTAAETAYASLQTGALPIMAQAAEAVDAEDLTQIRHDEQAVLDDIRLWWEQVSRLDAQKCIAKLEEYGSSDFDIMAQSMIAIGGEAWSGASDADKARIGREMAVLFYIQGKVARAFGALQKGRIPSEDTYRDITGYGMILRRIRETGNWGVL